MKKEYNRAILGIIGQIIFIIVLMIGTYFIFTGSRLASYASVAGTYDNAKYDLQMLYAKNDANNSLNELDSGVLQLRNPNKYAVTANVKFKVSDNANLDAISILINGNELDKTAYTIKDGYYYFDVEQCEMPSYYEKEYDTSILVNGRFDSTFYYNYDVTESFYS